MQETGLGISTTSPLYTLLNLAGHASDVHLAMAMYEFCGTFSVFQPSPLVETLLDQIDCTELIPRSFGWQRVKSPTGKKTNLWKREPLVEINELQRFAVQMKSARGGRRFARAAKYVTGITASPFEAQASMLLSLPRSKGGEGFSNFVNNERIPLSKNARRICSKTACYADLLFDVPGAASPLIVECQGKVVHDDYAAATSDSDRMTALQQMGFTVMPLTYRQIAEHSDAFLKELGYEREGGLYRIVRPNEEKVAVFCHAGLTMTWLPHLLGIPAHLFWAAFGLTHSGVTLLRWENDPAGYTAPKCLFLSDMSHIYKENLPMLYTGTIPV